MVQFLLRSGRSSRQPTNLRPFTKSMMASSSELLGSESESWMSFRGHQDHYIKCISHLQIRLLNFLYIAKDCWNTTYFPIRLRLGTGRAIGRNHPSHCQSKFQWIVCWFSKAILLPSDLFLPSTLVDADLYQWLLWDPAAWQHTVHFKTSNDQCCTWETLSYPYS